METLLIFAVLLVRLSPALSLFGEKKEIPRSFSYSIYRNGDGNVESVRGDSNRFSERQGTPPGLNVALGPAAPSVGNYGGPPYPPYGFKDPGFSVQTGFEGFLVPNPWYAPISWGIESIVLVTIGIIFVLALKAGLIFLLLKIFKFGKFFRADEGDEGILEGRSIISSSPFNLQNLSRITRHVLDGIDKYNDLIRMESEE